MSITYIKSLSNNAVKTLGLDSDNYITNYKASFVRSSQQGLNQRNDRIPSNYNITSTKQPVPPQPLQKSHRKPIKLELLKQQIKEPIDALGKNENFMTSFEKKQSKFQNEVIAKSLSSTLSSFPRNMTSERNQSTHTKAPTDSLTSPKNNPVFIARGPIDQDSARSKKEALRLPTTRLSSKKVENQREIVNLENFNTEEIAKARPRVEIEYKHTRTLSQLSTPRTCPREERFARKASSHLREIRSPLQAFDNQNSHNSYCELSNIYKAILRPDGPLQLSLAMRESLRTAQKFRRQRENQPLSTATGEERTLPDIASPKLVKNAIKEAKKEIIRELTFLRESNSLHNTVYKIVNQSSKNILEQRFIL